MTTRFRISHRATIAAAALALLGGVAQAATSATPCFSSRQWQGWSAPDARTLYLRVNQRDIYRVDLSGPSSDLTAPGMHLVFEAVGVNTICNANDLRLWIADTNGFRTPLFPRAITRLTPEEAAAIPKKLQP
jgi:hypothetical protein